MKQTSAPPTLTSASSYCSGLENGMEMLMPDGMLATDTMLLLRELGITNLEHDGTKRGIGRFFSS
jgi:hypothetical protein